MIYRYADAAPVEVMPGLDPLLVLAHLNSASQNFIIIYER